MAAKTPTNITTVPAGGGLMKTLAYFSDIDDNDTWASGITSMVSFSFGSTVDESDLAIDGNSSGTFTFGSSDNNGGYLTVIHMGY